MTVYGIYAICGSPKFTRSARDDAYLLYRHLSKDEEISTDDRIMPSVVVTDP